MKKFLYTITDTLGIHARPAGLLVKEASKFKSNITISKDGNEGDAKRIFSIMGLGIKNNQSITIKIDGEDEEECANSLQSFFKENL